MKKDYMARLERAARWRLPPQEAEEVISDYRDMFGTPPRPEEELYRDVGNPEKVVKLLVTPPRTYRVWLAVFAVMAACILTLGVSPTAIGLPFWRIYFEDYSWPSDRPALIAAAFGAVLTLVWFRWQGFKSKKLPKAIPVLLAVLVVWSGGVMLVSWLAMRDPIGFSAALGEIPSLIGPDRMVPLSSAIFNAFLTYSSVFMALLGPFALVRARTQDRRWVAVYVLALAAVMVCLEPLSLFVNMSLEFIDLTKPWYLPELGKYAAIFAVGLVGAGVSLC